MSKGTRPNHPHIGDFPWPVRSYRGKRLFDIAGSLVCLALFSPLLLVAAAAVKLTSRGPVFYRGLRAGLRGRPFGQLKFRTMRIDAAGGVFTAKDDPRVTWVGRFLRVTRIDELPQLINVLRGDMSLVGPRPEAVSVVEQCYSRQQLRVLSTRPGLASPVLVKFFPGLEYAIPDGVDSEAYYREVILPKRLSEDLAYVDRMSLWLDATVLLQTAWCLMVKSWGALYRGRRQPPALPPVGNRTEPA